MDYFSEDSAHVTNDFSLSEPAANTYENGVTHRRWAKAVLAFYAFLFLAGGIAIGVYQSTTTAVGVEQHATLRAGNRSAH
ncbi:MULTISPECIES: sigma-E processing peptidase SpoIIGA [Bradyrhizobium]|uniref:sigma-E processing peptidase SpoIIGA n=1 Tax=Bradyrhizobium TaxID=374 RepID=UPI001EDB169B|nr:sigma-E processing peptidase SpoIIGA [Bradyrhizobium zhengyangense]MCG2641484.1 sigma-E processing peptidase SpoIIGA [Bradyrhizobium zhengyangense]